jgi:FlaG/FlaF family flagellin (archaellin)
MNARLVFLIAVVMALVLPVTVAAQEKKDSGAASMTGCLNKGTGPGEYVLKDEKTGKETVVTGDAKLLAPHAANHQVTITGSMTKEKDKEVMKATDVKMLGMCK